jgi:hypothetical protein
MAAVSREGRIGARFIGRPAYNFHGRIGMLVFLWQRPGFPPAAWRAATRRRQTAGEGTESRRLREMLCCGSCLEILSMASHRKWTMKRVRIPLVTLLGGIAILDMGHRALQELKLEKLTDSSLTGPPRLEVNGRGFTISANVRLENGKSVLLSLRDDARVTVR